MVRQSVAEQIMQITTEQWARMPEADGHRMQRGISASWVQRTQGDAAEHVHVEADLSGARVLLPVGI